jgi:hypothetical protein
MPYRKHTYTFLIFIFTLVSGAFAQEKADFRVLQSQSNDTLYLKFELKRTSATPLLLGGYNLVFKIDPAVVDTNNFALADQGVFGLSTINYTATQLLKLNSGVFQIALSKKFPIAGAGLLLLDDFQNVGIAAFKIKKCGASGLSFPSNPSSSIIDWALNDVLVTSISISPLNLSSKVSPKPILTASKAVACVGSSVDFVADSNILFSNYTLFRRSETGLVSALSAAQAKSVFKNVVVSDTASYFVTFDLGTCKDTTTLATVFTAPQPLPVTITTSINSLCLGDVVTYTATPQVSGNKYVWKLIPIGTSAVFVGASAGLDVSSVQVDFKGTVPYSATLTVQDTNSFGCASPVVSRVVNPVSCTFNADFEVNGSNFAISACQSADVIFKDASTVSGGLSIVKWEWDFGPGAVPDTFSTIFAAPDPRNIPPVVKYTTAGVVGVRLIITNNLGAKDTIVKSPTISVLAGLTETPLPTCGSSSCNEVNFNWALVQGATNYQVRYKKGKNGVFQPYQNVGIVNTFKVNAGSAGMGGTLNFNDTNNDTVYFQVRALASTCDTTTSSIVFCKPSYCTTEPGCTLPPISIIPPVASCKGSVVQIKVVTTPNDFTIAYPNVAFSWDNGKFDTSHVYNAFITDGISQNVKLLVIDTTKVNCYSLNTISVPVTPILISKPDLGIQSLECDKVTFVWKNVEGAVKYQIKYSGTCIAAQDWIDAPLNGLAKFFEITNLTDSCKLNFNVRAVGGCNTTQSDTLVAPPTCSCYIGHIPSSNTKSCALDTVRFSVTDFEIPNWLISWENPITGIPTTPSKDSVFTFIPAKSDTIYRIKYTISNPTKASCNTIGYIYDTTGTPGNAAWAPRKDIFCINDAIYALNEFDVNVLENTSFLGNGIVKLNDSYYFDPTVAGLGTHIISHNACGSSESLPFKVVNTPCVSTVVDGGLLGQPEGLYTACDGTIYLSDFGNSSLFRYKPGDAFGIPELLLQSSPTSINESGNASNVRVGNTAGIVFDESTGDDVYFVDKAFNRIKRLEISKQKVSIISGQNGLGNLPSSTVSAPVSLALGRFNGPWGLAIHPNADTLYVADEGNRLLKSLTIKGNLANQLVRWRVGLLAGGINPPSRAKNSNIRLHNIAVDSGYVNISDYAFNYNISSYNFTTDSINIVSKKTLGDFADGFSYMQRKPDGVSPNIGDWTYFTDSENFALRRVNRKNGYMETVAGNPPPNPVDGTSNGLPLTEAKFSDPGPIAFNIRGYFDILDRTGASGKSAVRRYYIPRWGETWTGFDTTFVANCDRDTVRPVFGGGRLRVISGKDLTAVINDSIFAPKDTGQYLLGYYLKIGRCDTTFLRNVYVKAQPKLVLDGDTVCADSFLLKAQTAKDTSVRYKWFGPTKATAISASDTARSIFVKQSGDYYLGIFYGKNKQCSILDSAHVIVVPPGKGRINPVTPPLSAIVSQDSARICFGDSIRLSMDELSVTQPKFVKFKWSKGDTLKTIFGSDSTTYTVEAIDTLGCIALDTFTVVEQKQPKTCLKVSSNGIRLPIVSKKAFVCKGNVFSLQDSCNALPKHEVKWQKRTGAVLTTMPNATNLSDTGTYILTVTSILNGNLCPIGVKDSVHVVYFVPNASGISVISPTSPFVPCKPDTFKVTGTSGFGKYVWYNRIGNVYTPIDTTTANETTLKVNLNVAKVDSAYYGFIIQNPLSGCFDTTSLSTELKVKLYPRIIPNFIDSLTCAGNTTLFTPASVDSTQFSYNWDFGVTPTATSIKAKNSFSYSVHGTYQVQMIGWNKAVPSCKDTVTRSVRITTRPRLNLTINGLADTAKYCSGAAVQADLEGLPVPDGNAAGGPYKYIWQETYPKGGKLDSSFNSQNTIANPQTRVGESSSLFGYKVTVTDSKNCVSRPDSVYARVSIPPAFTVSTLPLSPICKGQSVTLTPNETVPSADSYSYSYKWDTSGVRLNLDADTFKAVLTSKPLKSVRYNLIIKNLVTLCESTIPTQIDIKEIQIQPFNIPVPALCSLPDSLPISPVVSNSSLPYQFVQWTDSVSGTKPITLFNPDSLNVKVWRDTTHTYRLVVRDNVGCSDTAFARVPVTILQPPAFTITKGKDTVACVGAKVKVSLAVTKGTEPYQFLWSKQNEVDTTDRYNPIISPTASGTYVVTMTDANKCGQATQTVTITQYDMKVLARNDAITGLCKSSNIPNPSAKLEAIVTNTPLLSGATYIYTWTNIGTNTNLNTNSATVLNVTNAGTYEVQVKNNLTGCVRKDTTSFKILNKPEKPILLTGIPSITCSARTISLSSSFAPPVSSKADSITYRWKVGANSTFQTPNKYDSAIVANLSTTDVGNVTFKVYAENKCGIDSSSKEVSVSGIPKPNSDLKGGAFCDTIVSLVASIVEDATLNYKWSGPNNINTIISDDATRSITTKTPGKYWVLIYDKNNPGCNRLDSATISINKPGKGAIQLVGGPANQNSIKVCFDVPVNLEMREATSTQAKFKTFVWKSGESTRSISAVGDKWFEVSATDSIGCVVTDSFKVEEEPRPIACIEVLNAASKVIPATNKQVNVCSGDLYTISDPCNKSSNGPRDSLIVTWQRRGQNGVLSTINPRGVTLTGSYTYIETISLRLKNGDICPNSVVDTVKVIELPIPSISIVDTATDYIICNNEIFELSAQPTSFVKYYWYKTPSTTGIREPFDTTTINSVSPAIVSLDPNVNFSQDYEVEGVDRFGCVATSSTATRAVLPIPLLDFNVIENCLGIVTKFAPAVIDSANNVYRWDFGDPTTLFDVSFKAIHSYLYPSSGTYKVRLSGQSRFINKTCNNYVEKTVTIKDPEKLDLTVNGVADTLKICGTANGVNLNAVVNSSAQTWTYDWTEIIPLGGMLDSTNTIKGNNTAKPVVKSGETTSLYGYSVQATDSKNCVSGNDTAYVRVSVAPEFELSLISNDTVCKGQAISISAINQKPSSTLPRYRYDWDTSSVDLGVNSTNLVSAPKRSITYRVTVLDSVTSCSIQKSLPIIVLKPIVTVSPIQKPAPCAAPDSIDIVANILQGLPLQSIQWIDSVTKTIPTTLYNPKLLTVKAFRDISRTYGLVIKDNIGCVDTTYVRVNASSADAPKFAVVNGSSKSSCVDTDVKVELRVITGRPQYSFVWTTDKNGTPATEVSTTDIFNPIISTSNISSYPKKYYVTFNDANNCLPALDSVIINQPVDMQVSINGNAANICKTLANPNPSTNLQAIPNPFNTNETYNYVWRNIETDQIVSSGSSFLNNVTSSGNYEVKVTNLSNLCERKDTALVSVINAPEMPDISILNSTEKCNNKPIQLIATFDSPAKANKDNITFEWSVIGGSNLISSFDSSAVYVPNSSDIGDIIFKVIAKNRCDQSVAFSLPKRLVAAAKAKLDVDAKEVSVNKNVVFTNNSTGTDSLVVLKITDGTNHDYGKTSGGTFNHNFPNKGTYKAKLFVINKNGCDDQDSVTITVIDKLNIFVPNVFSPSANDENNRFLRVYGVNISPQSFNFLVYNRWGQLVYSTSDLYTAMNAGWDGNDSSGESQMGVYTYILIGKFNTGGSINQTGTVTLLR